jgi:6-phosphofructokinase 1
MPTIERVSDRPYRWRIGIAELKDVANREKKLPREYITAEGFHITPACRRYLVPLLQGEAYPRFRGGLPDYVTLRNRAVARKLPRFEI